MVVGKGFGGVSVLIGRGHFFQAATAVMSVLIDKSRGLVHPIQTHFIGIVHGVRGRHGLAVGVPGCTRSRLTDDTVQWRIVVLGLRVGIGSIGCAVSVPMTGVQGIGYESTVVVCLGIGQVGPFGASQPAVTVGLHQVARSVGRAFHLHFLQLAAEAVQISHVVNVLGSFLVEVNPFRHVAVRGVEVLCRSPQADGQQEHGQNVTFHRFVFF